MMPLERDPVDVVRRLVAAIHSETASLELLAAKALAARRDGVLQFPWHQWDGQDRRQSQAK